MAKFEWKSMGGRPVRKSPAMQISQALARLLGRLRLDSRFDLCLHGIKIEARALLHRREVDGGQGHLRYFLLDKDEAPELVFVPLPVFQGSVGARHPCRALERIQA